MENKKKTATIVNLRVMSNETSNEYEKLLLNKFSGVTCNIGLAMADSDSLDEGFKRLPIIRERRSIAFRDPDSSCVKYRTTTHVLSSSMNTGSKIYLACLDNGNIEIYAMPDGMDVAVPISIVGVAEHIVDPFAAILYDDNIYIVVNAPSESVIARGTKARLPIEGSGDCLPIFTSYGCLNVIECDLPHKQSSVILRSDGDYEPYYAFISSKQDGTPALMVLNFDVSDNEIDDDINSGIGFDTLFKRVFNEKEQANSIKRRRDIPVGLSAFDIPNGNFFKEIPMTGDSKYGIESVSFKDTGDWKDAVLLIAKSKEKHDDESCEDEGAERTNKASDGND